MCVCVCVSAALSTIKKKKKERENLEGMTSGRSVPVRGRYTNFANLLCVSRKSLRVKELS